MHFLFIVDDYLPYSIKVAALMMHELALEFKKNGHSVTVLTPRPNQENSIVIQKLDEIEIIYFKSGKIKNTGKIRRAINESLLPFIPLKVCKNFFENKRYDGIVYYSPSIFWGYLVQKLKKRWNCPSYLILRDIFPQWTVDNGLMNAKSPIYWYFKFWEYISYKNADRIGVMSPSNLMYFQKRFRDISKYEVLYNWSQISNVPIFKRKYRKELNLKGKIVLFYGGNIGHAQQMMNLVNLAKQFKTNEKVHFLFVGKGDQVELILREKEDNCLSNITYLPSVSQEDYFIMLNEFDIGLFSLHPDHKTHNFPGKLLGYMNYSKPILGCVNKGNDLMQIINHSKAGIVVESGDNEMFYRAALQLIESEEYREFMGKNGRELLETQFSIKKAYNKIYFALSGN
ncbi:MAG: glycosyltransferase family 4 protein [Prolixibacteraceae bacterium]|nr:glycosyltransferase family 4 protein [Prolixibacteraceae bacterium]